jgi:hypothetical protein
VELDLIRDLICASVPDLAESFTKIHDKFGMDYEVWDSMIKLMVDGYAPSYAFLCACFKWDV